MSGHGEIAPWSGLMPAVRQHRRELAALEREEEKVQSRLDAIGSAGRRALLNQTLIESTCDQAMQVAPGGAARYGLLAAQAALAMASVIDDLARRTR